MKRNIFRQALNVLGVVMVLGVNALANALPLNGQNTGAISDRFHVYFVPAGYVFSIWGLIYLGLVLFGVYQALPGQRESQRLIRVGYLFALSCAANIAWLFLWHYERFLLTLVCMLALLLSLLAIYVRLGIGRTVVAPRERWCVDVPFSLYLGWITVATIANAADVLYYLNWGGWGIRPEVWTVIMLLAATGIAATVGLTRGDVAYMLVIVWAFAGIGFKQAATPVVAVTAWAAAALVGIVIVLRAVPGRRRGAYPAEGA